MTYTSYQSAYNTLLVELDRRRRYREAAEQRVHDMSRELEAMRDGDFILYMYNDYTFYSLLPVVP